MKKAIYVAMLVIMASGISAIHAESFKEKMKRNACEKSCKTAEKSAVDKCTDDKAKKGEKKDASETACKIVGDQAKEKCVSECMSK